MILLGSAVNGIAIVVGGLIGMFAGKLLPERIRTALVPTMSLVTIGIAVPGMMNTANLLIPILSMVVGTFIGELIDIDGALQKLSNKLQSKFKGSSVAEGFFTCSLVFAVGAVAVMGALDSGLKGDHSLLYAKALMDGTASIAFAAALGLGVVFSSVTVFVVEGGIALLAGLVADLLSTAVINEISFVGSLLIVGISLNMMGATKLRILNMVPALVLPIIFCQFM
mgnify:FL=1